MKRDLLVWVAAAAAVCAVASAARLAPPFGMDSALKWSEKVRGTANIQPRGQTRKGIGSGQDQS